jgi:type IV secretion system protein VirB5
MQKYVKHLIVGVAFSGFGMSAHAGIPVVDALANVRALAAYVQQALQYAKQVEQAITEAQTLFTQQGALNAILGNRNMAALHDIQALRQQTPSAAFNNMKNLTGATANANEKAAQLASAVGRIGLIHNLQAAIDTAPDAKAAADLQNRIQIETAHLENEKALLQAGKDVQDAQYAINAFNTSQQGSALLMGSGSPF